MPGAMSAGLDICLPENDGGSEFRQACEAIFAVNTVKKNLSTLFNVAIKTSIPGQTTNPAR